MHIRLKIAFVLLLCLTIVACSKQIPRKDESKMPDNIDNLPQSFDNERVMFDVYKKQDSISLPEKLGLIDTQHITGTVSNKIFGSHMSFFNESSRLRDQLNYLPMLKEFNFGLLRFPGGEEADNYLWDTKTVYRADWFYHKATPMDLDTDEFFKICQETGAQPLIVLNYDYGHDADTEEERDRRLFQYNKDWAEYIKSKGYEINYFEFGNEVIYAGEKFHDVIDPEQYAMDYLKMRQLLKEVDPSYQLGANMYAHYNGESWSESSREWASTFFSIVGDNCDFITPHLYYGQVIGGDFTNTRYGLDDVIKDWKARTKGKIGKEVDVIITEWNLWIRNDKIRLGNLGHGLVIADGIFGLAKGGASGACNWTLHWYNDKFDTYHHFNDVDYGLLKNEDNSFTTAGYIFSELSKEMVGYDIIHMEMLTRDNAMSHIALKSKDGTKLKILVANYSLLDSMDIGLLVSGNHISYITSKTVIGDNKDLLSDTEVTYVNSKAETDGSNITVTLPPYSLTVILCDLS